MHKITAAGLVVTALTFAAPAGADADVPGLDPFVGTWHAHAEGLTIESNGHGNETYADLRACPSCSYASAPRGSMDFVLTSVSGDTATGTVTAESDPLNDPIGGPVTVTLVGGGQGLQLSHGLESQFPFCNSTTATHFYCGG